MFASDLEAFLDTTIPNSSLSAFLQAGAIQRSHPWWRWSPSWTGFAWNTSSAMCNNSTESLEREVSKIWMHGREKVSHMNDQVTQAATSLWHNLCKPVVDERVGSTITYRASATLDEIWRSAGVSRRRFKKFKEGFSKIFFIRFRWCSNQVPTSVSFQQSLGLGLLHRLLAVQKAKMESSLDLSHAAAGLESWVN
jgi:hypothetical protein